MGEVKLESGGERLTRDEIWRRYPDEWVVLVDLDVDDTRVRGGVVYARSPDRAALRDVMKSLRREAGVFWTGPRTGITPFLLGRVVDAV